MREKRGFRHRLNRRMLALALLVLGLLGIAPAAQAIDAIVPQRTSLTVQFAAKGMAFTIYRVADMTGYGDFTPTADFAAFCSTQELNGLDSEGWSTLAGTLSGYAGTSGQWSRTANIGADGKAVFSDLTVGLYLVLGIPYETGGKVYIAQPTLVALPSREGLDDWDYDVCIEPKPDMEDPYEEIRVQKVWSDNRSATRPTEITVQLYINGGLYDTVKLSAANDWRYTWNVRNIAQPAVFQVTEVPVPSGYTHSIDYTGSYLTANNGLGKLITIVNRKCGTVVTPTRPGTLPQTGLLWWPVPLLAVSGMVLFVIGWMRRRRHEQD